MKMKTRLSILSSDLYQEIYGMTARQRRTALRELSKLSGINCGWTLWEMRHALRNFVTNASSARCKVRRRK